MLDKICGFDGFVAADAVFQRQVSKPSVQVGIQGTWTDEGISKAAESQPQLDPDFARMGMMALSNAVKRE